MTRSILIISSLALMGCETAYPDIALDAAPMRPAKIVSFDDGKPVLEVFLFDFDGDLYGRTLDVALIGWIRPEEKFASVEALVAQMNVDSARARDALKRSGDAFPRLGRI